MGRVGGVRALEWARVGTCGPSPQPAQGRGPPWSGCHPSFYSSEAKTKLCSGKDYEIVNTRDNSQKICTKESIGAQYDL